MYSTNSTMLEMFVLPRTKLLASCC